MTNATIIRAAGTAGASPLGKRNPLWTPTLLPGIVAAWDADATTVDASTPPGVTSWVDGIGGLVLTGGAGALPTKEGALNGHTPARFTSARYMTAPALTLPVGPLFACVINFAAAPTATQTIYSSGSGSFNIQVVSGGAINAYLGSGTAPAVVQAASGAIGSGLSILIVYLDADGKQRIRVNGVDKVGATINTATALSTGGRVGQYPNGTAALADASIGALLFAGGTQTVTDMQKLEGYLAQRFSGATFLQVGHPYRSTAPRKLT